MKQKAACQRKITETGNMPETEESMGRSIMEKAMDMVQKEGKNYADLNC